MPGLRRAGLVSGRLGCRCLPSSRPTARGYYRLPWAAPHRAALFFHTALGRRACARAWANYKKELPMFLSTLLAGVSRWFRYRDTLRQLSRLTDRELSDLGINRSDIRAVAWSGR